MTKKLNAAQRRYIENALLIAALGLTFKQLEKDYENKQLGEIADTTSGGTPLRNTSTYYGGSIPWIKSGELNDNLILNAEEYITEDGLANSSAKIFPKGTLVVALYGATVGKTGILGIDAASNQAVCAVFPKTKEITNEFIFWFLRHKRPEFLGMSFGGAQPNISQKIIREVQIPIPPLELQKKLSDFFSTVEKRQNGDVSTKYPSLPNEFFDVIRKIALVESLAARVNEAQRLREETEIEANKLLDSALIHLFENSNSPKKSLREVSEFQRGRFSWRPRNDPRFYDGDYPFIQIGDIPRDRKLITSHTQTLNDEGLKISRMFPTGTIVISIAATIGAVGILGFDSCMPDSLVGLNAKLEMAVSDYIYYFLKYSQSHFERIAPQSAQKNINIGILESVRLPVSPLDEQRRIVAYLDGLQAKVNALRELQSASREELSALTPSILDKAFKGEL